MRSELKWILNRSDLHQILPKIQKQCLINQERYRLNQSSSYTVNNIYYDNYNFDFLQDTLNGTPKRIKIRKRSYNQNNDEFLEIKAKVFDNTFKARTKILNQNEMTNYLNQTLAEIYLQEKSFVSTFINFKTLKPVAKIQYNRQAFEFKTNKNVTLTIDQSINFMDLRYKRNQTTSLSIVEIKIPTTEKKFTTTLFKDLGPKRSFSKYALPFLYY